MNQYNIPCQMSYASAASQNSSPPLAKPVQINFFGKKWQK